MSRADELKGMTNQDEPSTEAYWFRSSYIPVRMMKRLLAYVEHHQPVGSFLTAVLENDLKTAVGQEDDVNVLNLSAYIGWLYNEAPSACWGSPEKVKKWLEQRE